jgi:AcrR family transcriptional regulator
MTLASVIHVTHECQAGARSGTIGPVSGVQQSGVAVDPRRQVTGAVIRDAARALLLAQGPDVTMDEIAEAAGVSRRTVFRHFDSRDRLLAAALDDGIRRYGDQLPRFDGDWEAWLRALCETTHRIHAQYGPGYWELLHRSDLPAELDAVERKRHVLRRDALTKVAATLFREAGGTGRTPAELTATVIAHLSPRFTATVLHDAGQSWRMAAELSFAAIHQAVLDSNDAVAARR